MRRRTAWIAGGVAAAVAVGAGVVAVAAGRGGSGSTGGRETATAQVERRTIVVAETRDGAVGFADEATLHAQSAGTLTSLAPAGSTRARGDVLYRIDERPTVLMTGTVPAFRPMQEGTSGRDVKQLERNLRTLGYKGASVDRSYTAATADAVREWQDDLGVAQTGIVELGAVAFATTPLRVAAASAEVGAPVQPGSAIAEVSSAAPAVLVTLDDGDQDLAAVGDRVGIESNGASAADIRGRVASIDAVATGSQDGTTTTTYDVTVRTDRAGARALGRLPTGAAVDVAFAAEEAPDVLAVPVKALLALAEGGSGVEVVAAAGNRIVPVDTGLFADSWVEVTGDLTEGETVAVAP